MRPVFRGALVMALPTLLCCADSLLSPSESRALATAEAAWKARALTAYVFEYRQLCFCPLEATLWMRITVRDGIVEQVVFADSTSASPHQLGGWPTIDALFDRLDELERGSASGIADVVATFDTVAGYPTSVTVTPSRDILDGGSSYEIRLVEAGPNP